MQKARVTYIGTKQTVQAAFKGSMQRLLNIYYEYVQISKGNHV